MGFYVNPRGVSKEKWLEKRGENIQGEPSFHRLADRVVVCLVDNGQFTAAGIAIDQQELDRFTRDDGRPKEWFLVDIQALIEGGFIPGPDTIAT